MTTFTTEDRQAAIKLVDEAPYHPGYEDAVIETNGKSLIEEYLLFRTRHLNTSKKIVEFMRGQKKC